MSFNLSKRLFLILFGIIISLIILEVILQITSFGYQYYTKSGYFTEFNSHQNLTIVTLGESTTANIIDGTSWPEQLSQILSNNQISHSLVNLAVPAITTDELMCSFSNYLINNKPKIVIAMMGVNDMYINDSFVNLHKQVIFRIKNYLIGNFKVIKLFSLIKLSLSKYFYSIQFVSAELDPFNNHSYLYNINHYSRSFQLHSYNPYISKYSIFTLKNYYWLYELSIKYDFNLVLMQYPKRSINIIKDIFSNNSYDDSTIYYISNENNFKKILFNYSIESVFVDNFALDFGHCTKFGNELIAKNVYSSLNNYGLI